jgi:hypothetical protein
MAHEPSPHGADAPVDLGAVADAVLRSLSASVPRARVDRLLADLLEQEFSSARVTQFLPIFLHRVACETLRREADQTAVGPMP